MAFGLVGCGSGNDTGKGITQAETQTETQIENITDAGTEDSSSESTVSEEQTSADISTEDESKTADTETGKTLVVYFTATGNTMTAAEYIQAETGADIFEITPKDPYTSEDLDYNSDDSRVSKEHNDESLRDVELTTTEVPDWASYDTVFIGYPIWWGTFAWPVDSFVKANDFTGKTVYPFCTSASSGIGDSADDLAAKAGTGDWKEGYRFSSSVTQDDVSGWIKSIQQ